MHRIAWVESDDSSVDWYTLVEPVYILADTALELRQAADKLGKSMAQLAQEYIAQGLKRDVMSPDYVEPAG